MINFKELEIALKKMKPRSKLYELVRREVTGRGHWKALPRGRGFSMGEDSRRSEENIIPRKGE